jgi:hypothetical protein
MVLMGSSDGFVALTRKGHKGPIRLDRSDRKTEELVHKTDFACHAGACQDAVAATDHAHDLKAFDRRGGGFHPLEAAGRPDHALERTMIRLNDVVQYFDVRCSTSCGSSPSFCKRRIAFGYQAHLSVVMDEGG